MKIKSISFGSLVFAVYSVTILAFIFLPNLQYSIKYVHLLIMSFPLVVWVCIGKDKIINIFACLVLMVLFQIFFNFSGNITASINTSLLLYLCLIGYIVFEGSQKVGSRITLTIIIISALVMMGIVAFNTYNEFSRNPTVARLLARGGNDNEEVNWLRSMNIGGYGFSYAVGMLIPYVATWIIRAKGGKKWISILLFVALIVYAFKTQYTTLLLLSTIFSGYVFFACYKTMHAKIAVFVVVLFLIFGLRPIFEYLADITKLETLSLHFKDIAKMLAGEQSDSSRSELQWYAFELFIKNPLFGADLTNAENAYIVGHAHSTFASALGSYGMFGILLYYGSFMLAMKNVKKMVPTFRFIKPVFMHFVVLSFFNPITTFEIFAVTFLVIPGLELLLNY